MSTHRIIFTSLIFLCATNLQALSAQASFGPTLVIADTALDSTTAEFSKNIVLELCILEWSTCPNGDKFMQGKGSANLPAGQYSTMVLTMARKWCQQQLELILIST